jgi:hypothetical protein
MMLHEMFSISSLYCQVRMYFTYMLFKVRFILKSCYFFAVISIATAAFSVKNSLRSVFYFFAVFNNNENTTAKT